MSDPWSNYTARTEAHGKTKREVGYNRLVRAIDRHLPDNLSYQNVDIILPENCNNIEDEENKDKILKQNVAIIDSKNVDEKYIYSMPGEDIVGGSLVLWMGAHWLVVERDWNATVRTKCVLKQCNHLLKWISPEEKNKIVTQWVVIEDGTKYLAGELDDNRFIVSRGDSRIVMYISRNKYSVKFNRDSRFLVDDDDSPHKLAYQLTKPLKKSASYEGTGVFKVVMQEVTATEFDSHEKGIAEYYRYYPKPETEIPSGGEGWL